MKHLINILIIWFLVIQSLGIDAKAIAAIPMQSQSHCESAIAAIKYNGLLRVQYNCVDAGTAY